MANALIQKSEQTYAFLLKFYPTRFRQEFGKEMQYVFSEQLIDSQREKGDLGILYLWAETIIDASKSIIIQYIESRKGDDVMKTKKTDMLMNDKAFVWLAIVTGLILMIPLLMMQVSSEWNWGLSDFIIIGILLFGTGSFFILTARKVRDTTHRILIGLAFLAVMLYIWAELAVGIFTNLGS